MTPVKQAEPAIILLAEDNPADLQLTAEALNTSMIRHQLFHVSDGVEVLEFLRMKGKYAHVPRPDIILMDLNMPRKDGRRTLAEIKEDPDLKGIPVVILTVSDAEEDIIKSYSLHANCYVIKPMDFDELSRVISGIEKFWFTVVKLPPNGTSGST
jgi:two-component system, chemotaxis family, response regulator Rcp1